MKKLILIGLIIPAALFASCQTSPSKQGTEASENAEQAGKIQSISQEEALPMLQDSTIITIDVRTAEEIAAGYIDGTDLFIDVNGNFDAGLALLDKNKTYLVYCKSGARSSRAAEIMEKAGFTHIYNLEGGISSWNGPVKQ